MARHQVGMDKSTDANMHVALCEDQPTTTRRSFLRGGTLGALGSVVSGSAPMVSSASAQTVAQTYRFGGEVIAWHGRAPPRIEGQTNPTIQLQAGRQYRVVWENLDGQPHNFTIQDSQGNTLASTETVSEEGATLSMTFTASAEMAQYICTIHPTTMVGNIQIAGGNQGDGGEGGGDEGARISTGTYLFAGAILLAFISPLLFAIVLALVGTGDQFRPDK
ncbi:hypothetical protein DMJ13_23405 [halophilic archaeon]|nr:hypothetical protein DMJ13_23405 [halophilic archaeon]